MLWTKFLDFCSIWYLLQTVLVLLINIKFALGEFLDDDFTPYPSFIPARTNFTYNKGELATLFCSVRNLGTKTLTWRWEKQLNPLTVGAMTFTEDDDFQVHHIPGSEDWNLEIKNVQPKHEGAYECQVSTRDRKLRRRVYLKVKDDKKIRSPAINITGRLHIDRGQPIVLTCNATGFNIPPDEIDWFKDGQKISTSTNRGRDIKISKQVSLNSKTITSQLRVNKARMSDAGTYVCRTSDLQVVSDKVNVLDAGGKSKDKRVPTDTSAGSIYGQSIGNNVQQSFLWILTYILLIHTAVGIR